MANYTAGQEHHRAKLSNAEVELIVLLYRSGMIPAEIARKFDVARSTVSMILRGSRRRVEVFRMS